MLISLLTVLWCYRAGVEAGGNSATGLLAGSLVAFLPEFSFRGMNVSDDALATMCSGAATYLMVRITREFDWKHGLLATFAIAGGILSKVITLFLPAPFALTLACDKAGWRSKFVRICVLGSLIMFMTGPWLVRNQHLYGDPLAHGVMYSALSADVRVKAFWSPYFVANVPVLAASFVGLLGWMNLVLPKWVYAVYFLLLGFGGWSALRGLLKGLIDRELSLLLLSIIALNLIVLFVLNVDFDQPQGRYMFPALPAIAVLLAMGVESLPFWSNTLTRLTVAGWATANLIILVWVVIPAYWRVPK